MHLLPKKGTDLRSADVTSTTGAQCSYSGIGSTAADLGVAEQHGWQQNRGPDSRVSFPGRQGLGQLLLTVYVSISNITLVSSLHR